ncbi:MAG: hypothetical protein OXB86_04820 [Bdellovibrionales bacterium]|nr:hypothetical protein [Bdellovibrionales bacterium]
MDDYWGGWNYKIQLNKFVYDLFHDNEEARYFWMYNTFLHEMFHSIGFCHSETYPKNIMNPYLRVTYSVRNGMAKHRYRMKLEEENPQVMRIDNAQLDQWLIEFHSKEFDWRFIH